MSARHAVVALVVAAAAIASPRPARGDDGLAWYRGFYTRVGGREVVGKDQVVHAWAALSFGLGYRYDRGWWGVDASVLNLQYDPVEGLHTIARVMPVVNLPRVVQVSPWLGVGLSYGWIDATVDRPIPERGGQGLQVDAIVGLELPRALRARLFVHGALTLPLYNLYDSLRSTDSRTYAYGVEGALGVRF